MQDLKQLLAEAAHCPKQTLVVAGAAEGEVLEAVEDAYQNGIVDVILVGDQEEIKVIGEGRNIELGNFVVKHAADAAQAVSEAVKLVNNGTGDLLMKGNVGTALLLKAVLDRNEGLGTGSLLSHVAVMHIPGYHKLLLMTDSGLIINPTLEQKVAIIKNAVAVAHALGIKQPKVVPLAAVELVNPEMPATVDAALLSQMANRGQISGCWMN